MQPGGRTVEGWGAKVAELVGVGSNAEWWGQRFGPTGRDCVVMGSCLLSKEGEKKKDNN